MMTIMTTMTKAEARELLGEGYVHGKHVKNNVRLACDRIGYETVQAWYLIPEPLTRAVQDRILGVCARHKIPIPDKYLEDK